MVERVYRQAAKSKKIDKVFVATDHEKIRNVCKKGKIPVIMTPSDCLTGSDRVAAAVLKKYGNHREQTRMIVNIQGDEPIIDPRDIDRLVVSLWGGAAVAMGVRADLQAADYLDEDICKAYTTSSGKLLLATRRNCDHGPGVKRGVGIYGYRENALVNYSDWEQTPLEKATGIEVMRFVEHDYIVRTVEMSHPCLAVDTREDLQVVEANLKDQT